MPNKKHKYDIIYPFIIKRTSIYINSTGSLIIVNKTNLHQVHKGVYIYH